MNSSLRTANYTTHLKIVALSLVAAIAVVVVGISARIADSSSTAVAVKVDRVVAKAQKPGHLTFNNIPTIR